MTLFFVGIFRQCASAAGWRTQSRRHSQGISRAAARHCAHRRPERHNRRSRTVPDDYFDAEETDQEVESYLEKIARMLANQDYDSLEAEANEVRSTRPDFPEETGVSIPSTTQ